MADLQCFRIQQDLDLVADRLHALECDLDRIHEISKELETQKVLVSAATPGDVVNSALCAYARAVGVTEGKAWIINYRLDSVIGQLQIVRSTLAGIQQALAKEGEK